MRDIRRLAVATSAAILVPDLESTGCARLNTSIAHSCQCCLVCCINPCHP